MIHFDISHIFANLGEYTGKLKFALWQQLIIESKNSRKKELTPSRVKIQKRIIRVRKSNRNLYTFRLKHSTQYDFEIPTGFYVNKNNWSESKQEIKLTKDTAKDYQEINPKLRELRVFVLSEFNIAQKDGTIINRVWLEKLVQCYFERGSKDNAPDKSIYFTDFIDWFIKDVAPFELHPIKKTKRKPRTIQEYKTALKKFIHYEETKGRKFKLTEIDKNYYLGFLKYCEEYHKLNPNTTGGNIKLLNLFMHKADSQGYKVCKDYENKLFILPANETYDTAFTIEEIEQITNHDFSNDERLDNVRDWTVIGIWTGLRISDLLKLDLSKMNGDFFELRQKKTEILVVVPIHPDVQKILDKRK
ncbi:MAG: site-specific integrase [Bacillus cereus]|nr:site-specific integrase [Bacillus cereus]